MFLNSLDNKPTIVDNNGNTIVDLTQSMFDFKSNNYTALNMFRISQNYVMRPDLISQAVYNNTLYAEYILKYNGISNPFSMEEGDIILVPNLESAKLNTKDYRSGNEADPSKRLRDSYRYIDPTKIPKRDGDIAKFDDRNLTTGMLPPNIAEEGTTQITERNGRIYFGEGIGESASLKNGTTADNLPSTQITVRNGRVYFGEGIGESACLKNGMSSGEFLTNVIRSA